MSYKIFKFIFWLFAKIYLRLKVVGKKNFPKSGGLIVASNHVSYLDPVLVGVSASREINYMAKKELFENPIMSKLLWSWHVFPVKRDSADLFAIKEAMRRVKKGEGLMIFPEGTRQSGKEFGKPEEGVGFLVSKLNVPVIPVYVSGTDQALPKDAKFIKPKKVTVHFGQPISFERRTSYQDIAVKIMEEIKKLSCQALN